LFSHFGECRENDDTRKPEHFNRKMVLGSPLPLASIIGGSVDPGAVRWLDHCSRQKSFMTEFVEHHISVSSIIPKYLIPLTGKASSIKGTSRIMHAA